MKTSKLCVAVLGAALALTGCSTPMTRQDVGTVTGAVVGGAAGSVLTGGNAVGTVGGAAVGGYIGNRIGKDMDRR
ncbi:MAG: osmotically inducible lipoprotein OsmB [Betaproteobacteria bacterium HGW-Betaproteobacteria-14]|jgi:osmotically inducible lipoprotein OsmB|nr:MAG: osmotically inducible lipoprotein OsmB [Betaproteobacteria bacterium HGW-Betaproteobacteria-14]